MTSNLPGGDRETLDVDAIRARAEAATLGPWHRSFSDAQKADHIRSETRTWVAQFAATEADAVFIAHARQDVPDLLTALAAAERARDEAQAECADLCEVDAYAKYRAATHQANARDADMRYKIEAAKYEAQRQRADQAEAERDAALAEADVLLRELLDALGSGPDSKEDAR